MSTCVTTGVRLPRRQHLLDGSAFALAERGAVVLVFHTQSVFQVLVLAPQVGIGTQPVAEDEMLDQRLAARLDDVQVVCARLAFPEEPTVGILRVVDEGVAQFL